MPVRSARTEFRFRRVLSRNCFSRSFSFSRSIRACSLFSLLLGVHEERGATQTERDQPNHPGNDDRQHDTAALFFGPGRSVASPVRLLPSRRSSSWLSGPCRPCRGDPSSFFLVAFVVPGILEYRLFALSGFKVGEGIVPVVYGRLVLFLLVAWFVVLVSLAILLGTPFPFSSSRGFFLEDGSSSSRRFFLSRGSSSSSLSSRLFFDWAGFASAAVDTTENSNGSVGSSSAAAVLTGTVVGVDARTGAASGTAAATGASSAASAIITSASSKLPAVGTLLELAGCPGPFGMRKDVLHFLRWPSYQSCCRAAFNFTPQAGQDTSTTGTNRLASQAK